MATLDEIFCREFFQMMQILKGYHRGYNLTDIPLPPEAKDRFFVESHQKVILRGITEEYYNKLNDTDALLWGTDSLYRREFDYKGEFIKNKDGSYKLKEVTCPADCVAVVSPISIGVPNNFKSKEGFAYVDMITKGNQHRFVYLVPKKYCYKAQQTALVLSWSKTRRLYSGVLLSMQNGCYLYVSIIPYKPSKRNVAYRVLHTKTDTDYTEELNLLRQYWVNNNIIFNPDHCALSEYIRGRDNMACLSLDATEDMYDIYNNERSLAGVETLDDIEIFDNEGQEYNPLGSDYEECDRDI